MSMRKRFTEYMLEVGQRDEKLVVLVADISHFALQPFAKACPGRFYNVGICEPTVMSMSAGLAKTGLYPVTHTIAPFLVERSFEQMKLDFCYQGIGGNIITVGSAFDYAALGCTHHCYSDFAMIKPLPNTEITYPTSAIEFDRLFDQTYQNGKLTYFRLPEAGHTTTFRSEDIQLGKGIRVFEGSDLTIVATGPQLKTAVEARDQLLSRKISTEVLYYPTIKPFDQDLVRTSVTKTKRVLTVEEHSIFGGLADEVTRACKEIPSVRYVSQAIENEFVRSYGTYEDHCRSLGFTPENLVQRTQKELFS